jgi:CRP/FNR family transcriptional regulator, cyclic AMP receptor protein
MSEAGGLYELDPTVRAAWDESFLGRVPGTAIRNELLANAVISTFATGHLVQDYDFEWLPEPYPVSLVVEGVFRGYLGNPNGRQATVQYMRQGDTWGLVRTLSEKQTFDQRLRFQALVPSRLLLIRGARFMSAVQSHPAVGLALARELARVVTLRTRALESSIFSDTSTRVAQHIVQLAVKDPTTGIPTVWLSQQEMADAVGTVREVVTRIIGQFRARGIVKYSGRRLEILDLEALTHESQTS